MKLFDAILTQEEFIDNPPVLLDIGASGKIHDKWQPIAKYCRCIAFDADEREFNYETKENSNYKELIIYNCIVSAETAEKSKFYLTRSPYCSSLLEPDTSNLKNFVYSSLFEIEREVNLKTTNLQEVVSDLNIKQIDWFKSDSQGIDLRLLRSLREDLIKNIIVAEFEPGIIDAYKGEDKLGSLLNYMDNRKEFMLSDFVVKGTQRMAEDTLHSLTSNRYTKSWFLSAGRITPGWAELTYLNTIKDTIPTLRQAYLTWIFATLLKQHGFAYEFACRCNEQYGKSIFERMATESKRELIGKPAFYKYLYLARRKLKRMILSE